MVALEMAEYFGAEQLKTCVTSDSILKQKLSEKSLPALERPGKKSPISAGLWLYGGFLRTTPSMSSLFSSFTTSGIYVWHCWE